MERNKKSLVLKTQKNAKSIKLNEDIDKEYVLETIIQEYIDNSIDILDIMKNEAPNDIKMKTNK